MSMLDFDSAIDVMGGTGVVSYKLKQNNKRVTYNDVLKFNQYTGRSLIENTATRLSDSDISFLISRHTDIKYDNFIQKIFKNIYYTDDENKWLDTFIGNLRTFDNDYKIALALTILFQACIIKRPYNLFHRKNLYIRLADVKRTFGNKTTGDRGFDIWFIKFAKQYNQCIFDNHKANKALNYDILDIPNTDSHDLVYFVPPYTNQKNSVDYLEYYHFLEGLCIYLQNDSNAWKEQIDWTRKSLPLSHTKSSWNNRSKLYGMFEQVFSKFKDNMMVLSWNEDSYPLPNNILKLLSKCYKTVVVKSLDYQYALSPKKSKELLFIAQ